MTNSQELQGKAIMLALKTQDAYSVLAYKNWTAVCAFLLKRGFTEQESEAILRSKWMRWAGDFAEKNKYGSLTSKDLARFLDSGNGISQCEVDKLVESYK
jgi:hypothetical protein